MGHELGQVLGVHQSVICRRVQNSWHSEMSLLHHHPVDLDLDLHTPPDDPTPILDETVSKPEDLNNF